MRTTPEIRTATSADTADVARIVAEAYEPYIERIGRPPAPMTVDYGELISSTDHVYVVIDDHHVAGVLVLVDHPDHVFVDSVAVASRHRGRGYGRVLLDFAERRARDRGLSEVRLYTNATMTENLALYPHLGYVEVDRRVDDGYSRVYFVKEV